MIEQLTLKKLMTNSFFVLLFCIAPLFFQYNVGREGLFLPRNIAVWSVISLFLFFSLFRLADKNKLTFPARYWAFLALPAGLVISGFITGIHLPVDWFFRVLFILGGILFVFLFFQHDFSVKERNQLFFIIVLSVLFNTIISILALQNIVGLFPSSVNGRPVGSFQQVNTNASYLATGLLIAVYLLTLPAQRVGRGILHGIKLVILLSTIALSAYIIMLSSSRVGTTSVVFGFLMLLFSRSSQMKMQKKITMVMIIAFSTGAYLGSAGASQLTDKLGGMFDQYSNARIGIYQVSIEVIKDKPFLGHGIGSFKQAFIEKSGVYLKQNPRSALATLFVSHPHNEFLFWLVEGGLAAIVGIVISGIAVVLVLFSIGWSRGLTYSALLLPISLHTQVELPFYLSAIHWVLFLVIIYTILRHKVKVKPFKPSVYFKWFLRVGSVLGLIISLSFLFNTLQANKGIVQYNIEKTGNIHLLTQAVNNLYFNNYAERTIMSMSGVTSIAYKNREKALTFTSWAENYLYFHPDYVVQEILVKVYRFLEQDEKMCSTLERGLFLYPKNKEILDLDAKISCRE